MRDTRETLRRLQQQYRNRDTVKQFVVEPRNAATLVDVRYQTTWVGSDLVDLVRSDNVRIRSMQPTEQLNCKFEICLTEPFDDDVLDIIDG